MTGLISSIGYLRIESADTGAWREFGTKVLGMTEGRGPDPAAVYLRMDEFPARLVIVPGGQERLLCAGWEVADEAALAAVTDALTRAGIAVKAGDAAEVADRRVGQLLHCQDPSGNALEIFCGAVLDNRPAVSPYGNVFVTGDQGLGHVVLPATDDEQTLIATTRSEHRRGENVGNEPTVTGRTAPWRRE